MSNPKDYTIGWICAISTEYVAAQAFLDEKHEGPESVSAHDNNDYTLGRIGKHNVVVAVLPDGEYGISSATGVAKDMLHSFPNVRIGLMVGIGGGAPSLKHDIRLGDIVVSVPRDGNGGVFQYDFGKTIQNRSFQNTAFLNQPPTVLRSAVAGLRTQYESDGHQIEETINAFLKTKPRLQQKYQRPGLNSDRLYKSIVPHSDNKVTCAVACGDDPSTLITRPKRTQVDDNPMVHYGLIASANQLMKDAMIRDKLAAERGVLCFEMEAAGLMNQFPCLVVRGICDYSDSHKNKEWQGYAAMAAAAYAKDLLSRIAPNKVEAEEKISKVLNVMTSIQDAVLDVSTGVQNIVHIQHDQEFRTILDWLTSVDYGPQQTDFIRRRQAGTGQWLLDSTEFQTWLETDKRTLFCPGIPGAGKTILTAIVVEELVTRFNGNNSIGIAYLYCNFRRQHEQNVESLLSSLLKQLAECLPSLPNTVKDLYDRHKTKRTRPSCEELSLSLHAVAGLYTRVFVFIDALDECQVSNKSRAIFLAQLFNLQARYKVNLFVTSRFIPDIVEKFDGTLSIEIRASEDDVRRYLENHMSNLPSFIQRNPDLQAEVQSQIVKVVDGMFLLAKLHLDSLVGKRSLTALRNTLTNLRSGSNAYNHAYKDAMIRIQGQLADQEELAKQVLLWITCANRPLTATELQHALAIEAGKKELDGSNISDISDIVSVCAGLVTVDEESSIIRLVHYTTQEYFERTQKDWFPDGEVEITTTCVTYISFHVFASGPCRTFGEYKNRIQSNRLFEYAAQEWGHHARKASALPNKLIQMIIDFLRCNAKVNASAQATLFGDGHLAYRIFDGRQILITGLHLIAHFGVLVIAKLLLDKCQVDPDTQDTDGCTTLSWAARVGNEAIVELLLETGRVDPDIQDMDGRTPLSWAVEKGNEGIVKLLLETGRLLLKTGQVDLDTQDTYGRTPLSWAVEKGNEAIVKLLLEQINLNIRDKYDQTPLAYVFKIRNEAITKLLLETCQVYRNIRNIYKKTQLANASEGGYMAIVKLLLDIAQDDPVMRNDSQMILLDAAKYGHDAAVKLLLETDQIDPNVRITEITRTVLWWAAMNRHEAVVRTLLEISQPKVDADIRDTYGRTLLLYAVEIRDEVLVKLLLEQGHVDVNIRDKFGQAPLLWATQNGYESIVKLLLNTSQVNVNVQDKFGQTPLSWASRNGHEGVVKLLLKKDAIQIDIQDKYGRTPLSWAALNGSESIVKLLLETGQVNPDVQDKYDRTPLLSAAQKGHEAVVKLLLETGQVNPNVKDEFDYTPLEWSAEHGHEANVKLLRECTV
ncbi:hypothetical protein BP6252_10947 [Coleophoma cylindrospora]|uniref:Uncharacterized protein n=1 Tax=Coleophoma cylindrospora TaxID=1849047 RepID=A0A3D8QNM7_9HELO|nr:hypothetical protein BP6252_10947 [Coleophoma cylindrospora]